MTNHAAGIRPGHRLPMFLLVILVAVGAGLVGGFSALSSPSVPDENVRVTDFTPSGRADRAGNITLEFSNDLVPNDSLDRPILKPPLKFDPPLAGLARWIATDALRFYPDEPLAPATEYQVKVQSDDAFINGNRINEKRTFRFATPGLQIEQAAYRTEPVEGAPSQVRISLTLEFNYAVNLEQLTQKLEITGEANAERGRLSFQVPQLAPPAYVLSEEARREEEGTRAGFRAACDVITEPVALTGDTQWYRLRLKPGLECDGCGAPLRDEFYYTILVSPKGRLVIHRLTPRSTGTSFDIEVDISASINPDDVRNYVSVEPEIDFTLGSNHGRLLLHGDFQPGRTYTVTLAQGMPGSRGAVLEREFSSPIAIPDVPASVAFTARGSFLSRKGSGNVELRTINVDELAVEVEQVFENNLLHFLAGSFDRRSYYRSSLDLVGRRIFFEDKPLAYERNRPLLTTVDVSGIVGDSTRGVFVVTARDKERRSVADSRQVMLTDIGISARMADNFLMVWVHSLADTRPLGRAQVRLISKNNQVLAEGQTDTRGIVTFDNLADRTAGFEPYVITVTHEDDLSYLRFQDCLLPTEDFDVGGRPYLLSGYEAFLYCDRGIYRPGDTAHIVSIVRGVDASVPPEFPFSLNIRDPQGKPFQTLPQTAGNALMTAADYVLPVFAPTGRYTITAEIGDDYEIGRTDFLVEEFMPDRIKVTLATPKDSYRAGDELVVDVTGVFLFGPPARGHRVGGRITFEHDLFRPIGWGEYTFTTPNRTYARTDVPLPDSVLDGDGRHRYTYQLRDAIPAPSALKALLSATVSEQGGRAVGAYKELRIDPYDRYLGLHPRLDGYAKPGETVSIDVIALDADGRPVDLARAQVRFNRIVYHSIFKGDQNGRYRYVSERSIEMIDSTTIRVPQQGAVVSFTPPEYGQYEIAVADGADGHAAAVRFYASGWGYAPWSMANPDRIEIDLNQSEYQPGATAVVQVRA
ncbi:MAG TPA: MG2 domain-containing protein, partial [Acidobacteriota bacterium]|nr:MG2 domain-containing protein [Acidobacteriota bacterium]